MTNELTKIGSREILGKTVTAFGTVENPLFDPAIIAEAIDYNKDSRGMYDVSKMLATVDDDEKVLVEVPAVESEQSSDSKKQGNLRRKKWFLTEGGLYEVLFLSRKPLAREFKRQVKRLLRDVRTGHSPQIESIQTRLQLAEQKLQLFEEYNEDILYDFDQVAAAMRIYRKPPFGASHLKRWLADKKIICSAHHKNDKPIQQYINRDWFRLVMHEWKRRGVRRYEPRYLITQRGFNGMIDLAIREHVIHLPLPKDYCLPNLCEPLPPEVGGTIYVDDYNGNEVAID